MTIYVERMVLLLSFYVMVLILLQYILKDISTSKYSLLKWKYGYEIRSFFVGEKGMIAEYGATIGIYLCELANSFSDFINSIESIELFGALAIFALLFVVFKR